MTFDVGTAGGAFSVSRLDVARLDDIALRDLLRLLIEAEGRLIDLDPRSIDVGGAQTAPDGGVDARVRWEGQPKPRGWLPARDIVFQCKATPMPPSAMGKELKPRGVLRPFFAELAEATGTYILVTTEDIGSRAVQQRITAMRSQLDGLIGSEKIALDIYAADRLARWANGHVGVAMWLLQRSGRGLEGWRPYGDWSKGGGEKYLLDAAPRAKIDGESTQTSAAEAIEALRGILADPGGTARLVGISGTGKTRLAEALFDIRVDAGMPLRPSLAVYGDAGLALAIPPALIAERLASSRVPAVLIVDNCTDRLHAQLAEIVGRYGGNISLLTIDYEVAGERPEGTHIVALGEIGDATIDSLIAQRFPKLGQIIRQKLVEFAGGNARVALAIARGVSERDTLSDLDEPGLLDRLFQDERRGGRDAKMRPAAEAASLVYAFYADQAQGIAAEHATLASIAGLNADDFYGAIERMLSFGIAQQRVAQRAVKPDALADRLAAIRLRSSDPSSLLSLFASGPSRLFASFARRIGRLHNEPKANAIAKHLLSPEGWLGNLIEHDDGQRLAFLHVAPAAREDAIAAIERATTDSDFVKRGTATRVYADTLAHIAWDASLFERAMRAMLPLVIANANDRNQQRELFLERFWPALSFTMADTASRLRVIDSLLSGTETLQSLGIEALDAMLETGRVSSSFQTQFGTRNQLREWRWTTAQQRNDWFDGVYARLVEAAQRGGASGDEARSVVAKNARANSAAGVGMRVIAALRAVRPEGYWDMGWREVTETLHFDRDSMAAETRTAFEQLERELMPRDVDQAFEAFVMGEPWRHWHPRGGERRHVRNVAMLARGCGVAVARAASDTAPWLSRAVIAPYGLGASAFGKGLASRTVDLDKLWADAVAAFSGSKADQRSPALLSGIIEVAWKRNEPWARARLSEAASDRALSQHSVTLHPREAFDRDAVERFMTALDDGRIAPAHLSGLMYGGVSVGFDAADIARLLSRMIDHPEGAVPALEVLQMRLHGRQQVEGPIEPELLTVARRLVEDSRLYRGDRQRTDYDLYVLARCLLPDAEIARAVARNMVASNREDRWASRDFTELKRLLVSSHLEVMLDELVAATQDEDILDGVFSKRFADDSQMADGAASFDEQVVLGWIAADPQVRATRLAEVVPYAETQQDGSLAWSSLALAIIDAVPDRLEVLRTMQRRFHTGVSHGPFYLRYVRRLPLLDVFLADSDPAVREWASAARQNLNETIRVWQARESQQDSTFE